MAGDWVAAWREPISENPPDSFLSNSPLLLRVILWRRGLRVESEAAAFLDPFSYVLPDTLLQPQLDQAVARLALAVSRHECVAVWGDYDADGQTATALLVGVLRKLGVPVVSFHLSCTAGTRGLTSLDLLRTKQAGASLLITCDFGTNGAPMLLKAATLGLEAIVTDHHIQLGDVPKVVAVLNSSHVSMRDAGWGLSGVAVAFVLARGLLRHLGHAAEANQWLDLVALGSIVDVAPLTVPYRAMLARGVIRLWEHPRPGIRALLALSGKRPRGVDTAQISFTLGPVLNAAGRIGSPSQGVQLLLETEPDAASALAVTLLSLRDDRNRMALAVETEILDWWVAQPKNTAALVAVGQDWHPGVLGRVSGSLSRRFGIPAVVISVQSDGGNVRGSARASGEVDLTKVLAHLSDHLDAFGGHAHAAGFTVKSQHLDAFREAFNQAIAVGASKPEPRVEADVEIAWNTFAGAQAHAIALVQQLSRLAPYSAGNSEPVFVTSDLRISGIRPLGSDGRHLKLLLTDSSGHSHELKWWSGDASILPPGQVDVAYTVSLDEWQGSTSVQFILRGIRQHL